MTIENASPALARLHFMRMVSDIVAYAKQTEQQAISAAIVYQESNNVRTQQTAPQA